MRLTPVLVSVRSVDVIDARTGSVVGHCHTCPLGLVKATMADGSFVGSFLNIRDAVSAVSESVQLESDRRAHA